MLFCEIIAIFLGRLFFFIFIIGQFVRNMLICLFCCQNNKGVFLTFYITNKTGGYLPRITLYFVCTAY